MDKTITHSQPPDSRKNTKGGLPPLRIGELLVKEGLVKKEDIRKGLSIQKREQEIRKLPLGQILVEMGALSESNLQDLLNHPDLKREIGILAVERGVLDKSQLEFCLEKRSPNQLIGEVLIEEGLLTYEDLERLLREQISAPRLGELAVKLKVISERDLENALRIQKSSRKLGEILCSLNLINPLDLNYVLNKYNKQLELAEITINLGYITKDKLNIALEEQKHSAETLEEILLRKMYLTQDQLLFALSQQYNMPFRDLDDFVYEEHEKKILVTIISQKYAEKNLILPISLQGKNLTLALCQPRSTLRAVYELKAMYSYLTMQCILITKEKFEDLFEILYSDHLGGSISLESGEEETHEAEIDFMELTLEEELKEKEGEVSPYGLRDIEAEELVNFIIKYGIINSASDIHIEQDRKRAKLRYRLDGVLRETSIGWLKEKLQDKISAVISRIKIMSSLDIAEKRLPQDGVFRINYYDKARGEKFDLDFRVATCRGIAGENVTIRILDPRKANVSLERLNHSPHVLESLKILLKSSAGMILVCGPTGSGKSSTLYAALQYLYNPGIKIITAEDPIEYNFPGIMQTQVNPKINLTFSRLLRSFLRFDPDVIFVGEMRDEETAKIGFDAAQTGHLILSTLHTNDAVGAIPRLLDLNVEHGQIASSLMCVVAQRLVRRICPSCIEETVPAEDEWGMFFKSYPSHQRFFKGKGCEVCNFTGYKGRTLLSEILVIDSEISHALNKGYDEKYIKRLALESGMKTMLDDSLSKLNETTLAETIRMVPQDMIKEFRSRGLAQDAADLLIENQSSKKAASLELCEPPSTFQLSQPEKEKSTIDLMKTKYEALKTQNGDRPNSVDPLLFKEFITESFHQIREEYECTIVDFSIKNNPESGKTEIKASPGP